MVYNVKNCKTVTCKNVLSSSGITKVFNCHAYKSVIKLLNQLKYDKSITELAYMYIMSNTTDTMHHNRLYTTRCLLVKLSSYEQYISFQELVQGNSKRP